MAFGFECGAGFAAVEDYLHVEIVPVFFWEDGFGLAFCFIAVFLGVCDAESVADAVYVCVYWEGWDIKPLALDYLGGFCAYAGERC